MNIKKPRPLTTALALTGLIAAAIALSAMRSGPADLAAVHRHGALVVAIPQGPASYYVGPWGPAGFEFELARHFAAELGVDLQVVPVANDAEALALVDAGDADFAAGLAITPRREQAYKYSLPVQSVTQLVVCEARNKALPVNAAGLAGRDFIVSSDSHHTESLRAVHVVLPSLAWHEIPDANEEALLGLVQRGEADCAAVDANTWAFHRHLFPELRVAFDLPDALHFGWAFNHDAEGSLREAANAFVARRLADGGVKALQDRYYAHMQTLTQADARRFTNAVRFRLPRYTTAFRAAAEKNDIDWRLLAAVSYQESLWDPTAQSPTGVQGLMQLTLDTALQLGIDDRTDPLASIKGGARYLRQMIDELPAEIPEQDRTWMALAAYNAGMAHILDARELTRQRGGNPNSWADVGNTLPLLKQHAWYSKTRYGYARGATQAVIYVRHVRRYYDLLVLASNSQAGDDLMIAMASLPPANAN